MSQIESYQELVPQDGKISDSIWKIRAIFFDICRLDVGRRLTNQMLRFFEIRKITVQSA